MMMMASEIAVYEHIITLIKEVCRDTGHGSVVVICQNGVVERVDHTKQFKPKLDKHSSVGDTLR
jgi:hypothetical protein